MENVTHGLIGISVGESAAQLYAARTGKSPKTVRTAFWITSGIANNLPDLDILYSGFLSGKMGYLLHHRGHSHTIGMALPIGFALFLFYQLFLHFFSKTKTQRKEKFFSPKNLWILSLCLLGPIFHLAADFLNSYGIHPFWPFSNRWVYGDRVFILEPWLWLVLSMPLFWISETKLARCIFGGIAALSILLVLFSGYVDLMVGLFFSVIAFWLFGVYSKLNSFYRNFGAWLSFGFVILFFTFASGEAKTAITEEIHAQFPSSHVVDISLQPSPANPLCWTFNTVELTPTEYISRNGIFALLPRLFAAAECTEWSGFGQSSPTFTQQPVNGFSKPYLLWKKQFTRPKEELTFLKKENCFASAFFKWSRVPAWEMKRGSLQMLGDLRYDRGGKFSFSKFDQFSTPCPRFVPQWETPLLHAASDF